MTLVHIMNQIPNKDVRINVRFTKDERKRVDRIALKLGKRLSQFVRDIVLTEADRIEGKAA